MTFTFSPGSMSSGRSKIVTGSPVRLLGTHRGGSWRCRPAAWQQRACSRGLGPVCMAADLQFIRGVNEPTVPDVKLTRSRDGSSGTATFVFQDPSVFEASGEMGDITGLYMLDDEGTITTVDVQAKFVNGKPDRIEAKYVMKNSFEWERFMRFMERYAQEKELGFTKKVS